MKIALCQCPPNPLDVAGNLARLARYAAQASEAGAALLVLPEMFSSGYAIGAAQVQRLAEPCGGPFAQAAAALARHHRLALCYGYPERGTRGIYNSAQLLGPDGTALLNYRKVQLFGELDRTQFAPGGQPPAIANLYGWAVGLQICYDIEFPEGCRFLARRGAQLVLVPTANMRGYEFIGEVTVRSRAFENHCYVAYANYCGGEAEIHYCGGSSVNGPAASRVALGPSGESLLYTTLDQSEMTKSRRDYCYLDDLGTLLSAD